MNDASSTEKPIAILDQRRIEAEIIKPLMEAFEAELGREKSRSILEGVIKGLARKKGRELAGQAPDSTLTGFATLKEPWVRNGSLEFEVLTEEEDRYEYNVTRCRYAEMYRELGLADLGFMLSCDRDAVLIEGFNPEMELQRTQTIMEGASFCDFRYKRRDGS